jgi:hypothetical protein
MPQGCSVRTVNPVQNSSDTASLLPLYTEKQGSTPSAVRNISMGQAVKTDMVRYGCGSIRPGRAMFTSMTLPYPGAF